jgi:enoyl-[acyl-carrier-protein] reductase (NADH)
MRTSDRGPSAKAGRADFAHIRPIPQYSSIAFRATKTGSKERRCSRARQRQVFTQALDISAYTYIAMANRAAPLMTNGGAMIAMRLLRRRKKPSPANNVMGVAKSALESATRYLANDLGPKNIRVNTISGGPLRTMSALAVGGFSEILGWVEKKSPLRRNVTGQDVGDAAGVLAQPALSGRDRPGSPRRLRLQPQWASKSRGESIRNSAAGRKHSRPKSE